MAKTQPASRKRPLDEVENESPGRKRVNIEQKSPKTAIRDASAALIIAIQKAEEVYQLPPKTISKDDTKTDDEQIKVEVKSGPSKGVKNTRKGPQKKDPKSDSKNPKFVLDRDEPTGLPYVYIVLEKTLQNVADILCVDILGTFATLTDANNFVRNHCMIAAERDHPDANFFERTTDDGRISWEYLDDGDEGVEVSIEKCVIKAAGSEPVNDWGRPIGAPCPSKENSEVDSEDSSEEHIYPAYMEYQTRRY